MAKGKCVAVRRDTGAKLDVVRNKAEEECKTILDTIQTDLFNK